MLPALDTPKPELGETTLPEGQLSPQQTTDLQSETFETSKHDSSQTLEPENETNSASEQDQKDASSLSKETEPTTDEKAPDTNKRAIEKRKALLALTNATQNKLKSADVDPNSLNSFLNNYVATNRPEPQPSLSVNFNSRHSTQASISQKELINEMLQNIPNDVISTAVVIKNINFSISRATLLSTIKDLGLPTPRALNYHYENGLFRGLAFSNFRSDLEAIKVIIGLNGVTLLGRPLVVTYKKKISADKADQNASGSSAAKKSKTDSTSLTELIKNSEKFTKNNLMRIRSSTVSEKYPVRFPSLNSNNPSANNYPYYGSNVQAPPPPAGLFNQYDHPQLHSSEALDFNNKDTRILYDLISKFRRNPKMSDLNFPSSLDAKQRQTVMLISEKFNLNHETKGDFDNRSIRVYKNLETLLEGVEINSRGPDLSSLTHDPSFLSQFGNSLNYIKSSRPLSQVISLGNSTLNQSSYGSGYPLSRIAQTSSDLYNAQGNSAGFNHPSHPSYTHNKDFARRSGIYRPYDQKISSSASQEPFSSYKPDRAFRNSAYLPSVSKITSEPKSAIFASQSKELRGNSSLSETSDNTKLDSSAESSKINAKNDPERYQRQAQLKVLEQRSAWRMSNSHVKPLDNALFQIPSSKAVPIVDLEGNKVSVSSNTTSPAQSPKQSSA
ncbi:hypothetical protein BB560_006504 [Smittium megazygosporum]|uniref:RRM domain-containing protein n=1 Tax=Smittium megazygosporum TaxID=133381 RepID=A0A2T9Y4R2_9FUNG|nr:hypothetical protein BB560_006504 [Smittium megazygosporum]